MSPKATLAHAFAETAKGNGRPFTDMLADDVDWEIIGTTDWSKVYRGKVAVMSDLLRPLNQQFDGPNTVEALRFIADGDTVMVEGRNLSTTKRGDLYPNRYCWVFEFEHGRVSRITEYCDTALIDRVLVCPRAGA